MEPRLTEIDRREVLTYLRYRGGEVAEDIRRAIESCCETILAAARPRAVWRVFDWDEGGPLPGTDFTPEGRDIRVLLRECRRVILFAATLGSEVDALLRCAQVTDMARAVILDSCASAAIENVCDNLCADLGSELGGYLTDRFSPGYGDFPFTQQPDFCRVLDVQRRIGVSLTPGGLMIPQKSVTALMGLADTPQKKRRRGCERCGLFENCEYRKEGRGCGHDEEDHHS